MELSDDPAREIKRGRRSGLGANFVLELPGVGADRAGCDMEVEVPDLLWVRRAGDAQLGLRQPPLCADGRLGHGGDRV
jgi:hypothetical protein